MGNNTQNSKLDETVKNTLSNYEANYDAGDWARMESMLDAAPKSNSFKWSYSLNIFIGVAVLAGGYLIYKSVSNSKSTEKSEVVAPVIENKVTTSVPKKEIKMVVAPVVAPIAMPTVAANTNTITTNASINTENKITPTVTNKIDPTINKNVPLAEKTKVKKTEKAKANTEVEDEFNKNQQVFGMGNEPIFGDMLDSSKGIIGETKEKEELKKAAKQKAKDPVGWNSAMLSNINPDSLRSYRARNPKDSLKKE